MLTRSTWRWPSSIWLHPSIPLQFEFFGSKEPRLNRVWLEELVQLANTPAGLHVTPEPVAPKDTARKS